RRTIRSRPIGQDPILGDHVREPPPFHRLGVRPRPLRGRGRSLRTIGGDHAAGGAYGDQDRRSSQHPFLSHHLLPCTPAADAYWPHFCIVALRMVKPPFVAADGIRFVSTRGASGAGSGKSFTPLSRMHWANLRAADCCSALRLYPV